MFKNYNRLQQLEDLYRLLAISGGVEYDLEQNEDESWTAELIPDGKLAQCGEVGYGSTKEEAVIDMADRFITHTPCVNDVPINALIRLMYLNVEHNAGIIVDAPKDEVMTDEDEDEDEDEDAKRIP